MKNLRVLSPFLTSLLLASVALAQAGSPDAPDAPQPQPSVAERPEPSPAAGTGSSTEDKLISQARQCPRRPTGPRRGYAYPGFPPPPALSPVGALIGFGVGAAAGAANPGAGTVGSHVALGLIGGGIGALIGGAIGAAVNPFLHARRVHQPSEPDDEDQEANLRREARKTPPKPSISETPAPSPEAKTQGTAQALLDDPSVP